MSEIIKLPGSSEDVTIERGGIDPWSGDRLSDQYVTFKWKEKVGTDENGDDIFVDRNIGGMGPPV